MEKERLKRCPNCVICFVCLLLGVSAGWLGCKWSDNSKKIREGNAETVRVVERKTVVDTIECLKPVVRDSTVVRYVSVKLPLAGRPELPAVNDTLCMPATYHNHAEYNHAEYNHAEYNHAEYNRAEFSQSEYRGEEGDSATVVLPIGQRVYRDSTYTAWVSGYDARLDSIHIYRIREETLILDKTRRKRWHIGVGAGVGYGRGGVTPYVGIGISYSIAEIF